MATPKIRAANTASTSSLSPELPITISVLVPGLDSLERHSNTYLNSLHRAADLPPSSKDRLYTLFDSNMSHLSSSSSMPYTESSKREELFDESGRILLLRRVPDGVSLEEDGEGVDMPGRLPPPRGLSGGNVKGKGKGKVAENFDRGIQVQEGEIMGYISFRFDTEETLGSRDAEVIYCYELQLDPSVRRLGLGKVLMDHMEAIGKRRGLDKAMLTCLKGNEPALLFYRKQGYEADEIDPTRMEEEPDSDDEEEGWEQIHSGEDDDEEQRADYVILSKPLR